MNQNHTNGFKSKMSGAGIGLLIGMGIGYLCGHFGIGMAAGAILGFCARTVQESRSNQSNN